MIIILNEKRNELATILDAIKAKQAEIDGFEYETSESEYDEFLDECYGDVEICGSTYSTSHALKELNPTAYRCGKVDYDDNYDYTATVEYQDLEEELEELESQRDDLESEIEELEDREESE